MAAKRRNARRTSRRKSSGTRRTAARRPAAAQAITGLTAEIRGLSERLAACERRQDETLAAVAAAMEALQARDDDTQAAIHDLQAAVEPLRMAATGTASSEEIARQVDYLDLVARVRRAVRDHVPRSARVLVVGRGDEELVRLFGRTAAQFPQDAAGDFAGEYPADGPAAVAALERLAAAGWDHLVIPATSAWWLDHYRELRVHLHREWLAVHHAPDTCTIFTRDPARPGAWHEFDAFIAEFRRRESRSPAMLDWETGSDLTGFFPGCAIFPPVERGVDTLPYLDRSIDIVAVPWGDAARRAEARRIASAAVVEIAAPGIAGPGYRIAVEPPGRQAPATGRAARHVGLITPVSRPTTPP
ncbi:MAG: hypothetical protein ACKOSQ_08480 [Planctomycetaceae bacterium]